MKELFSSLYYEASNRMKSPIIGTFALCWLAYNHVWVAEFVLAADNADRLTHIKASNVSFSSDVFFPLLMASAYIFGVPFIQWGVDKAKYRLIEKRRLSTHHSHLSERYESQAKVSELQSKATLEYWQELHKNNAINAGKQIILLKEKHSFLQDNLKRAENNNRVAEQNYNSLNNMNNENVESLNLERNNVAKLTLDVQELTKGMSLILFELNDVLNKVNKPNIFSDSKYQADTANIMKIIEGIENGSINTITLNNELRNLNVKYSDLMNVINEDRDNFKMIVSQVEKIVNTNQSYNEKFNL